MNSNVGNAILYVPTVSIKDYKNRSPWNLFGEIRGITNGEDPNGISQIQNNNVKILSRDGMLDVQGVEDGNIINIYNGNGILMGASVSKKGHAFIYTNLKLGSMAIVKIGEKSVKVIMR